MRFTLLTCAVVMAVALVGHDPTVLPCDRASLGDRNGRGLRQWDDGEIIYNYRQ